MLSKKWRNCKGAVQIWHPYWERRVGKKKCLNIADIQWINFGNKRGVQIQKFCGLHIWTAQKHNLWRNSNASKWLYLGDEITEITTKIKINTEIEISKIDIIKIKVLPKWTVSIYFFFAQSRSQCSEQLQVRVRGGASSWPASQRRWYSTDSSPPAAPRRSPNGFMLLDPLPKGHRLIDKGGVEWRIRSSIGLVLNLKILKRMCLTQEGQQYA